MMSSLAGRRVLVTGVSGFVGGHLARLLAARVRADVWGSGLDPDTAPRASSEGAVSDYSAGVNLTDPDAAVRLVEWARPDAIVHLAGQSSAARSFEKPVETFAANAVGTWNLLEAAHRAAPGARVLVVGSGEVYGSQPEGTRVGEGAPLRPVSPYALAKAAADAAAEVAHARLALDVVRTRSFGHIGPGQTPTFVVPSITQQIARIEAGMAEPVIRVGNLAVTRDITDVRDVVEAYLALLEHGRSGAAYNVCRGEGTRLADLAQALCARARVPVRLEVDPSRMRPADISYLVGDPAAIGRDVGWRATTPLDRTLDDVLDEWRSRSGRSSLC